MIRDPEVLEPRPGLALWGGGEDGLDVMRGVVARAAHLLPRPAAFSSSSTPTSRAPAVVALLEATGGFVDVADHRDLAGRDRFTTGRRAAGGSPP